MARVTVQNRDVCFRDIKKCIECFVPERRQSEWSWNFIFDVRELRTSLSWLLGTNMKNGMYLVRQRLFDSRIQHVGGNTIFHVSLKSNSWAHVVPASLSIKDNFPPPPTCLSSAACRDRWGVRASPIGVFLFHSNWFSSKLQSEMREFGLPPAPLLSSCRSTRALCSHLMSNPPAQSSFSTALFILWLTACTVKK